MTCKLIVLWTLNRQAKIFLRKRINLKKIRRTEGSILNPLIFFMYTVELTTEDDTLKFKMNPSMLIIISTEFTRCQ